MASRSSVSSPRAKRCACCSRKTSARAGSADANCRRARSSSTRSSTSVLRGACADACAGVAGASASGGAGSSITTGAADAKGGACTAGRLGRGRCGGPASNACPPAPIAIPMPSGVTDQRKKRRPSAPQLGRPVGFSALTELASGPAAARLANRRATRLSAPSVGATSALSRSKCRGSEGKARRVIASLSEPLSGETRSETPRDPAAAASTRC